MTTEPDFDVAVIGAGGAGLAAAVSAADAGASVLIVEAADTVGGATTLAGGSYMAAGTPVQAAAGYPGDTADAFFDHYLTFNRWAVDPAIARRFCDAALPTFEWLVGLGVRFTPEGLYRATREPVPRSHRPVGGGQAYVDALHRAVRSHGVDIALRRRVDSLVPGGEGTGYTIGAGGDEMTARSVVLATGGFGANSDLVRRHFPDAQGEVWSPAPQTCRGDGLELATAAGAATSGVNHGDLLLTAGFVRDIEPFVPPWLLMVGRHGRRFVDESAPYAVVTPLALEHGPCWVVLDDRMLRSAKADPASAWGAGTWTADTLLPAVADGHVLRADTVEELAAAIGTPGPALAATIRRYNESCAAGADTEYLKKPAGLVAVDQAPYYAVRLWPAVVALTGYGPRIDPDARVLRAVDGDPVPNLYAAGELTGNVLGPQYLGGGNAIGNALVFGRIAGLSAAAGADR
ncbi:FAD-dependent oxidoreductase [Streptosporangium sp. NBC_01755]|uniref:FAD-dependent oxidoreductase n=1 Tax=unclassified Streptosporangium TaxID=2632669 RepID=UPI002DD85EF8|nr:MULTISPECIES: FAD-dependent oxidoreductase [unclassified Streptosporangium]WSA24625.1 FAD-dependent oxidoreductase [Streptosporangium sp. NBC_01810]WSC97299.1 FAD-dependent oxidoreductase [Streptosporangium sp. NBC_01755]